MLEGRRRTLGGSRDGDADRRVRRRPPCSRRGPTENSAGGEVAAARGDASARRWDPGKTVARTRCCRRRAPDRRFQFLHTLDAGPSRLPEPLRGARSPPATSVSERRVLRLSFSAATASSTGRRRYSTATTIQRGVRHALEPAVALAVGAPRPIRHRGTGGKDRTPQYPRAARRRRCRPAGPTPAGPEWRRRRAAAHARRWPPAPRAPTGSLRVERRRVPPPLGTLAFSAATSGGVAKLAKTPGRSSSPAGSGVRHRCSRRFRGGASCEQCCGSEAFPANSAAAHFVLVELRSCLLKGEPRLKLGLDTQNWANAVIEATPKHFAWACKT